MHWKIYLEVNMYIRCKSWIAEGPKGLRGVLGTSNNTDETAVHKSLPFMKMNINHSCSLVGVLHGPLSRFLDRTFGVGLPEVCNFLVEGVVEVGRRHQGLDREEHGPDLEGGAPLIFQDVKADSSYKQELGSPFLIKVSLNWFIAYLACRYWDGKFCFWIGPWGGPWGTHLEGKARSWRGHLRRGSVRGLQSSRRSGGGCYRSAQHKYRQL